MEMDYFKVLVVVIISVNFVKSENGTVGSNVTITATAPAPAMATDCVAKRNQTYLVSLDIEKLGNNVTDAYSYIEAKIKENPSQIDCKNLTALKKVFQPLRPQINSWDNDSCIDKGITRSLNSTYKVYMDKIHFLDFLCTLNATEIKGF